MDLRIFFGIFAACDDGVFEGLDEGQSEYERRLTDSFGTVDGFGGGVFEERQAEVLGFGNRAIGRDFVGRGRMRLERTVGAPDEFFAAKPAVALGKCAFDLAAVDARDNGVADVVNRFDVAELVFAGERVEFDFEHADAVGIVGERLAAAFVDVVVDVGRCVVTGGRELDAVGVGPVDDLDDIDWVFATVQYQRCAPLAMSAHYPLKACEKTCLHIFLSNADTVVLIFPKSASELGNAV